MGEKLCRQVRGFRVQVILWRVGAAFQRKARLGGKENRAILCLVSTLQRHGNFRYPDLAESTGMLQEEQVFPRSSAADATAAISVKSW
jgi:hypothetical protein